MHNSTAIAKFTPSSKKSPCPVCGREKDGDCRTSEQGNLVFCHTYQTGDKDEKVNGYRFHHTSDKGAGWGVWVWHQENEKGKVSGLKIRPKVEQRQYFNYPDRSGKDLIRVVRQKGGTIEFYQEYWSEKQSAWIPASKVPDAAKAAARKAVPIYRYAEVQMAIKLGSPIVWVEGESAADALWAIGIAATTSIGGSKALTQWGDYSKDLNGANLIIAPDRDKQGIQYADAVRDMFKTLNPSTLNCYPKSPVWENLPDDGGLDVADWIAEGATKIDLVNAVSTPVSERVSGSKAGTERSVSDVSGVSGKGVDKSLELEEIRLSVQEATAIETAQKEGLDLYKLLPYKLADAMTRAARCLPCAPEALLTTFLASFASVVGTSSVVRLSNSWKEALVTWTAVVEESGSMKTPAQEVILDPLIRLQAEAEREYKKAMEFWEENRRAALKNQEEFEDAQPIKRELYLDDLSFEAISHIHNENPRGFLVYQDELDAFYAGQNKHRGGKGDDSQRWLSLNKGGALKVNKLSRKAFIEKTAVSITGTIQPLTAFVHLRDSKKNNSGMNARWNYCAVKFPSPLDADESDETAILELQDMLYKLYKAAMQLPGGLKHEDGSINQVEYLLSKPAYEFFHRQWKPYIVRRWESENDAGFKTVLAKQRGYAGRNAALLHLVSACMGELKQTKFISEVHARGGAAIAQFFCDQAQWLYGLAGMDSKESDETEWTPILLKLKEASLAAKANDGWIGTRDARRKTRLIKSAAHARQVFAFLYESGIGELDTSGSTPKWKWVEGSSIKSADTADIADTLCPTWLSAADIAADMDADTLTEVELQDPIFFLGQKVVDPLTGKESKIEEIDHSSDGIPQYFLNGEVQEWRSQEQLTKLPARIQPTQQPVDIASTLDWKGFQVGDLVECVFPEWMDERSRKESAKMNEAPYGARGTVKELVVWDLQLSNLIVPAAIVEFEFGTKRLALDQLNRL